MKWYITLVLIIFETFPDFPAFRRLESGVSDTLFTTHQRNYFVYRSNVLNILLEVWTLTGSQHLAGGQSGLLTLSFAPFGRSDRVLRASNVHTYTLDGCACTLNWVSWVGIEFLPSQGERGTKGQSWKFQTVTTVQN